jgi:hypothetical protein
MCDGAMSPDFEVAHFKHRDRWFAARTVRHASHKRDLPKTEGLLPANIRFEVSGKRYDLFDYLSLNRLAWLLVLKNGCVGSSRKPLSIKSRPWDQTSPVRAAFAVAKGLRQTGHRNHSPRQLRPCHCVQRTQPLPASSSFVEYYHRNRTHLGLQKDTPESRPVQSAEAGHIISIPEVGGLHHHYERRAA